MDESTTFQGGGTFAVSPAGGFQAGQGTATLRVRSEVSGEVRVGLGGNIEFGRGDGNGSAEVIVAAGGSLASRASKSSDDEPVTVRDRLILDGTDAQPSLLKGNLQN